MLFFYAKIYDRIDKNNFCMKYADLKPTGEVECSGRNGLPVVSVGDVT